MRIRLAILTTLLLLVPAAAAEARRSVPYGFIGVMGDGLMMQSSFLPRVAGELNRMSMNGVESDRVAFYWFNAQPYRSFADVPASERSRFVDVGGVPTDWSRTDFVMHGVAKRRLLLLPVVFGAPRWAARYPGTFGSPPSDNAAYGRFLKALVQRYGPGGSFWAQWPKYKPLPVRHWQVWNEPDHPHYWVDRATYPTDYVNLLRAARPAMKQADPGARVVMAGVSDSGYHSLPKLYAAGMEPLADIVALHTFTRTPDNILTLLRRARGVMTQNNDSTKELWVTEWSWPTSYGKPVDYHYTWEVTERGQATRITQTLGVFWRHRRALRLGRTFYYNWLSDDRPGDSPFAFAGLRRLESSGRITSKPGLTAYRTFALRAEGCAAKGYVAWFCTRRAR